MNSQPREEHPYIPWWELEREPQETPESAAQMSPSEIGYIGSATWLKQERKDAEWKADMQKFFDNGGFTSAEMAAIGSLLPDTLDLSLPKL